MDRKPRRPLGVVRIFRPSREADRLWEEAYQCLLPPLADEPRPAATAAASSADAAGWATPPVLKQGA
jgi:hypothetical protein